MQVRVISTGLLFSLLSIGVLTPTPLWATTPIQMLPPTAPSTSPLIPCGNGVLNQFSVLGWDSQNPLSCVKNIYAQAGQLKINSNTGTTNQVNINENQIWNANGDLYLNWADPTTSRVVIGNGSISQSNYNNFNYNQIWNQTGNLYLNYSTPSGATVQIGGAPGTVQHFLVANGTLSVGGAVSASGQVSAQMFIHSSDARLKTDVHPVYNALDRLLSVQGVEYKWKKDGRADMGIVAQNVASVFPNVVSTNSDGMMAVEYDSMVAPLIEAIRELKLRNDQLQQKVDALSARIENQAAP